MWFFPPFPPGVGFRRAIVSVCQALSIPGIYWMGVDILLPSAISGYLLSMINHTIICNTIICHPQTDPRNHNWIITHKKKIPNNHPRLPLLSRQFPIALPMYRGPSTLPGSGDSKVARKPRVAGPLAVMIAQEMPLGPQISRRDLTIYIYIYI